MRVSALVYNRNMTFSPILDYKYFYFRPFDDYNVPSFTLNHCCKNEKFLNVGLMKAPPHLTPVFPSSPPAKTLDSLPFLTPGKKKSNLPSMHPSDALLLSV